MNADTRIDDDGFLSVTSYNEPNLPDSVTICRVCRLPGIHNHDVSDL